MSSANESCNNLTYEQVANWFQPKTQHRLSSQLGGKNQSLNTESTAKDAWLRGDKIDTLQIVPEETSKLKRLQNRTSFEAFVKEAEKAQ